MSDMSVNRTPIAPRITEQRAAFHPKIENKDVSFNQPISALKSSVQPSDMRASESPPALSVSTPQMIRV
ncbi:MAG TPA: hypothetical protein DHW71_00090 [Gammaproteobacteria bacterium]|nr:hypothetical protein [Gammaproteobacteria bacterium]MEC8012559.1 hypothetical protein [Pseudomonadota bacterium]HBF10063.1 hypothetical protein [Gammaproteobacteria bacterium]HCK91347.1 hypothetical protein [Gammaproteobacteria bacterium]|tara:strand:+ start:275 stop:481 length:207 start_codon:yes stop_codon:yes gene_type:complete